MAKRKQPRRDARDPYRDSPTWEDRGAELEARPFWVSFKWIVGATAVILAVVALVWVFSVGSSDVRGRGGAVKIKNDATNRIQQSEYFEQTKADYDTYPNKLAVAQAALDRAAKTDDPTDDQLRETDLTGLQQQCLAVVADYNARARKYTAREFRASDLPNQLDSTTCTSNGGTP